jgi:hypothetical protein
MFYYLRKYLLLLSLSGCPPGASEPARASGLGSRSGRTSSRTYNHAKPIKLIPKYQAKFSVADPGPGSGAFLTSGSGMEINPHLGSGIRDEHPGSYL